jgi:uridylate kinase
MKLVFSVGGSILAPDGVDPEYVSKAASLLLELAKTHEVAVVVGGGRPARAAIAKARDAGASWAQCDHVGVLATRENAKALIDELGDEANQSIPESIHQAAALFGEKILVMGGTEPGHSTDAVACILADWVGADMFINASNVDAVYDRNPKDYEDAKPLKTVAIDELISLLSGEGVNAGEYPLLDHVALVIIKRSKIKSLILDGRDLENMKDAADGRAFNGTTVVF